MRVRDHRCKHWAKGDWLESTFYTSGVFVVIARLARQVVAIHSFCGFVIASGACVCVSHFSVIASGLVRVAIHTRIRFFVFLCFYGLLRRFHRLAMTEKSVLLVIARLCGSRIVAIHFVIRIHF